MISVMDTYPEDPEVFHWETLSLEKNLDPKKGIIRWVVTLW